MFGFLRPARHHKTYRQLYAGCCGFQHARYGIETLPLLSYEAVFLYVLAADAGACRLPHEKDVTCCRLRRRGTRLHEVDTHLAEFCSSFGVLLASIKLEDDVRDDRSLVARLALWRLAKRIEQAKRCLSDSDRDFRHQLKSYIEEHLRLEQAGAPITLQEYAKPTAEAFAYVFGLFAQRLPADRRSESLLRGIGAELGRAVICFDCAADWQRDRQRNAFNPLPNRPAVEDALLASQQALSSLLWQCAEAFGLGSRAAAVVRATFDRVSGQVGCEESNQGQSRQRIAWRLRRGGFCDCDCDLSCCDGCDCTPGDGAAGLDAGVCSCYDCGYCGWWGTPGGHSKEADEDLQQTDEKASWVGKTGRTLGPLAPSGVVLIEDQRLPARSEHGWIDGDKQVVVVADGAFGVVVREMG